MAVDQLTEAVVTLGNVISPNVYGELQSWLHEQQLHWDRVLAMVWRYNAADEAWDGGIIKAALAAPVVELSKLTNLALENASGPRTWYELGTVVGDYQPRVQQLVETNPLPSPQSLLDCTACIALRRSPTHRATHRCHGGPSALRDASETAPGITAIRGSAHSPSDLRYSRRSVSR